MTPPTPPLPPACADCVTVMKPAQPGAAPQQYATRIQRAADGKMRMDSGASSVIVDPPAGKTILLDHVKKEAHIAPLQMPAPPGAPQVPGMPGFAPPGAPPASPVQVQDLGKGSFAILFMASSTLCCWACNGPERSEPSLNAAPFDRG